MDPITVHGAPWCPDCRRSETIPTIVFPDGSHLLEPSVADEPAA